MTKHVQHGGNYVNLSADFICGIIAIEDGLQAGPVKAVDIVPQKIKHASGPVKARATSVKRMKK